MKHLAHDCNRVAARVAGNRRHPDAEKLVDDLCLLFKDLLRQLRLIAEVPADKSERLAKELSGGVAIGILDDLKVIFAEAGCKRLL